MPPPHLAVLNSQEDPAPRRRLDWLRAGRVSDKKAPPRRRDNDIDMLADLPPAQVPLAGSPPAPQPERTPAAERAFRAGSVGETPRHAMSATELAAWRDGAMAAGRARDPIIGLPRIWWWLALGLLLLHPLAYAALWCGLPGTAADFLMTAPGREAWLVLGPTYSGLSYWALVLVAALALQALRPLEPVLILLAGGYWVWTGLHLAYLSGWLAQPIPPLPIPG